MPDQIQIGIIGNNDRTVSDLLCYLNQLGTRARRLTELSPLHDDCGNRDELQAIVIFPDDFEAEAVDRLLDSLSVRVPALLQLIVTRQPFRFAIPTGVGSTAPHRCVIPRPAFSWFILDTIRAHLEREP